MLPEAAFIVEVDNTNVLSTIFFTIANNRFKSPVQVPGCQRELPLTFIGLFLCRARSSRRCRDETDWERCWRATIFIEFPIFEGKAKQGANSPRCYSRKPSCEAYTQLKRTDFASISSACGWGSRDEIRLRLWQPILSSHSPFTITPTPPPGLNGECQYGIWIEFRIANSCTINNTNRYWWNNNGKELLDKISVRKYHKS